MRLLSIDNIKEHMQIARTVYAADGCILLREGMTLSGRLIERLKELGITSLYITDHLAGKVEVDELVRVQTKIAATKALKDTLNNIRDHQGFMAEKINQIMTEIIDEILSNRKIPYNLVDIRAMNDYLFGHSLAVSVLSLMMGISAGYNYGRLKELGVGAILHDIGKILIADEIVNKPAPLTPEEFMEIKKHPQLGYEILKKSEEISSVSAHIAWQHHERLGGTGYPRGLKAPEIHDLAKITAIVDVYDAMSTDRSYRARLITHDVIEFIRDGCKGELDPDFTKLFLENVAPFPIGTMVNLNNSEKGLVVQIPKDFPSRPIVRVMFDPKGTQLDPPVDRDLKKDLTLYITGVFNESPAIG